MFDRQRIFARGWRSLRESNPSFQIENPDLSKCVQVVSQLIRANRAITRTMSCCVGGKQPFGLRCTS